MRDNPVASEKIAVDQARCRPRGRFSTSASIGTAPVGLGRGASEAPPNLGTAHLLPTAIVLAKSARMGDGTVTIVCRAPLVPSPGPRRAGISHSMPNIKQQKKRVRTSEEDRVENLRYRSTVKTMTRRLEAAIEAGDKNQIAAEHTALQRWIDRATARGAIHRNTAARKKAQAARLVAGR